MMVSDFGGIFSLLVDQFFIIVTKTREFGYSLDRVIIVDKQSHLAVFPLNSLYTPVIRRIGNQVLFEILLSRKYEDLLFMYPGYFFNYPVFPLLPDQQPPSSHKGAGNHQAGLMDSQKQHHQYRSGHMLLDY